MNAIAIIQARMQSTRLPGKVLADVVGHPMLARVVERTARARLLSGVIVATTDAPADEPIVGLCRERCYLHFRGSQEDVLDRYYRAACEAMADPVVRITSDCPLIDPQLVDLTIQEFLARDVDFAANRLPPPWHRTYPKGLDVEVCRFDALERAWREANQRHQREHVMPYLYEQAGRFKTFILQHAPDYGAMRWSVDTVEDLCLVRRVYQHFKAGDTFGWLDVVDLMQNDSSLTQINTGVKQKDLLEP